MIEMISKIFAAYEIYSVLSAIQTINSFLDNGNLNGVDVYYASYQRECNILAWYGYKVYLTKNGSVLTSTGSDFQKNAKHTWNGHPYDYTQPAACRVLVNQYP